MKQLKLYPAEEIELGSLADDSLRALAEYQAATGNVVGAAEICEKLLMLVLAGKTQSKPEAKLQDAVKLSNIYRQTADIYRRGHRPELAFGFESRRVALWRHWDAALPNNAFVFRKLEGANGP